jgi:hypothetical protein
MKRKLSSIKNEVLNSFGGNASNQLELKKTYSKIELEKMEIERKKKENKSTSTCINVTTLPSHNDQNQNKTNIIDVNSSFMADAKIHKSTLEREIENFNKEKKLIGMKRDNSDDSYSFEILSNKKPKTDFQSDWSTLMSNSVKKKPLLEREKEIFLEECKRKKEEQLKTKSSSSLVNSQVMIFDDFSISTTSTSISMPNQINKSEEINVTIENNKPSISEQNATKVCVSCEDNISNNYRSLSKKCKHYIHQVNYFLIYRNVGLN